MANHTLSSASLWSSETLVKGAKHVSQQPEAFLTKTENIDVELEREFQVTWSGEI